MRRTRAGKGRIPASSAILLVPLTPRRVSLLSPLIEPAYGFPALGSAARDVTGVVTHLIGAKPKEPLHRLGYVLRMDDTTRGLHRPCWIHIVPWNAEARRIARQIGSGGDVAFHG